MNQIDRIKIKLRLARNTDTFLETFGSSTHKYKLGPPMSIEEMVNFERNYDMHIPDGYRRFLTEVGNGGIHESEMSLRSNLGAGPGHGLYRWRCNSHSQENAIVDESPKEKPFFDLDMTDDKWREFVDNIPDDISDEDYDKEFDKAYAGILSIAYEGCSNSMGIMVCGDNVGRVVYAYDELEYCPTFANELNFLDWYENWLDGIISGKSFAGGNYTSEILHFSRLAEADTTYWKLIALQYIKSFDELSDYHKRVLWVYYGEEEDATAKLYIFNLLVKFDYENTKSLLSKLSKINPLEFLKIIHLYASSKISEWDDMIQELSQEEPNLEVNEYIKYLIRKDAFV